MRLAFGLCLALLALPGPLRAAGIEALREAGFAPLWAGYAVVASCVPGQDRLAIGPYFFFCGGDRRAYPNHFGSVAILVRVRSEDGARRVDAALCLDGAADCLPGQVFRR